MRVEKTVQGPVLQLKDAEKLLLVNMIPRGQSSESGQESAPFLAVHPDAQAMVATVRLESAVEPTPLFSSVNQGWDWSLSQQARIPPATETTLSFSGRGRELFGACLDRESFVDVFKVDDPTGPHAMQFLSRMKSTLGSDEPFIQAGNFDRVRIYVGQNWSGDGFGQRTAAVQTSVDGGERFEFLGLEARETSGRDGPPVRPAVSRDGTVYVAFFRLSPVDRGGKPIDHGLLGDLIVCRDDRGGIGASPFQDLRDASDQLPGRIVEKGRILPIGVRLGEEIVGPSLSLSVSPVDSSSVCLAWVDLDLEKGTPSIHVRRSNDRGVSWHESLAPIPSASNPSVAIAANDVAGLLYQRLVARQQAEGEAYWETRFVEVSNVAGRHAEGMTLVRVPASQMPPARSQPYLGRTHLIATASSFHGVFAAPNIPDPSFFPHGVSFRRHHREGRLLPNVGETPVAPSIDPYCFRVPLKVPIASSPGILRWPAGSFLENAVRYNSWNMYSGGSLYPSPSIVRETGKDTPGEGSARPYSGDFTTGTSPGDYQAGFPGEGGIAARVLNRREVPAWTSVIAALIGMTGVLIWYTRFAVRKGLQEQTQGPVLLNYTGYITVRFTDKSGRPMSICKPRGKGSLVVEFSPEGASEEGAVLIDLNRGKSASEVDFQVQVDRGEFELESEPKRTLMVKPKDRARVSFAFTAPLRESRDQRLFVQVFQKTQLIQVVPAALIVESKEGRKS